MEETLTTFLMFSLAKQDNAYAASTSTGDVIYLIIFAVLVFFLVSIFLIARKTPLIKLSYNVCLLRRSLINRNKMITISIVCAIIVLSILLFFLFFIKYYAFAAHTSQCPEIVKLECNENNKTIGTDCLYISNTDSQTPLYINAFNVVRDSDIIPSDSTYEITVEETKICSYAVDNKYTLDNPLIVDPGKTLYINLNFKMNFDIAKSLDNTCPAHIEYFVNQNYNVSGMVVDVNNSHVANKEVQLRNLDGSVINVAVTDENGIYYFNDQNLHNNVYINVSNNSDKYSYQFKSDIFSLNHSQNINLIMGPAHNNLKSYTLAELKYISKDFSQNVESGQGTTTSQYWNEFGDDGGYIDLGIRIDSSDNGTGIIEDSHWAIDTLGRIATDYNFGSGDSVKKYEFRIIGINQDYTDKNCTQYAGLTMMATHSYIYSEIGSCFEDDRTNYALYGWEGDIEGGKCTLQSYMNDTLKYLPEMLDSNVVPVYKKYGVAHDVENVRSTLNKYWVLSLTELSGYSEPEQPYYEKEGNYYLAFKKKSLSVADWGKCIKYLHYPQDGLNLNNKVNSSIIYTRTLFNADNRAIDCFDGISGILNIQSSIDINFSEVPAFCL